MNFDQFVSMIFISFYQRQVLWSHTCPNLLKLEIEWWLIWQPVHGWFGWNKSIEYKCDDYSSDDNLSNRHIIGSRVSWCKNSHVNYTYASEIFTSIFELLLWKDGYLFYRKYYMYYVEYKSTGKHNSPWIQTLRQSYQKLFSIILYFKHGEEIVMTWNWQRIKTEIWHLTQILKKSLFTYDFEACKRACI